MRIGIMSMQRVCNAGSFLQAYALKKIIESYGHEVIFIDYRIEKPIINNKREWFIVQKKRLSNFFVSAISHVPFLKFCFPKSVKCVFQEEKKYKLACSQYLNISNKKTFSYQVDLLIIGSDEVFNFTQLNPIVGFSRELFGKNANAKVVASYAASFGNTTLEKIKLLKKEEELKELLKNLKIISVRDLNSKIIIQEIAKIEPVLHFDPVLIYDFSSDCINKCTEVNFILVYAYRNRLKETEKKYIVDIAKKEKKKIVTLGGFQNFGDLHVVVSPLEAIDYFKKADYVFTDTFHGTILSVINERQFQVFVRNSENNKYGNEEKLIFLLNNLGLESRILNVDDNFIETGLKKIDYKIVNNIISREKQRTFDYINELLNEVQKYDS